MSILSYEFEIRELIRGYLSILDETPRYIGGAFVKVSYGRLCAEHDEGWTLVGSPDGPLIVLDYSPHGAFGGEAGLAAVLDWLRP